MPLPWYFVHAHRPRPLLDSLPRMQEIVSSFAIMMICMNTWYRGLMIY